MRFFCLPHLKKKEKEKEKKTIQDVINMVVASTKAMTDNNIIFGSCEVSEYFGWHYTYRSVYINSTEYRLVVDIMFSPDMHTTKHDCCDECAVCFETTDDTMVCCGKHVCQKCIEKIQKSSRHNFACPLCRKNLNSYAKSYIIKDNKITGFAT